MIYNLHHILHMFALAQLVYDEVDSLGIGFEKENKLNTANHILKYNYTLEALFLHRIKCIYQVNPHILNKNQYTGGRFHF